MYFNPRSLTGATTLRTFGICQRNISIHAPSRERQHIGIARLSTPLFQSPLPRGSDRATPCLLLATMQFQSTLPRGSDNMPCFERWREPISIHAPLRERLLGCSSKTTFSDFNPRSLAGATISNDVFRYGIDISIHAPSRERQSFYPRRCSSLKFQSTLPRGSDLAMVLFSISTSISIHAPSRERQFKAWADNCDKIFQSTLPRGSDRWSKKD